MKNQSKPASPVRPVTVEAACLEARALFDDLLEFCTSSETCFAVFEKALLVRVAVLGCCLVRVFLTAAYHRLKLPPFLANGKYRPGADYAERTLKTFYGEVTYGRQYLLSRGGGSGCCPLDVVLGLSSDRLSPWVRQWVARLATRMSFKASRMVCHAVLNWAPATATIEQTVLGMGREAAPFMKQLAPPSEDGEVLVIEVDGKCPPIATAAELAKRSGKRKSRHGTDCVCGCQRHRGRSKRRTRGSKKRRKRGDKSKNGKEISAVVMYTLKRGADGKLHGPLNKKLYGTFAGRKAAALWARAEATKRGFGPDTTKTIQIVLDGAQSLRARFQEVFPKAIFTLDVCHVVERLWRLGRHFHAEGSAELTAWVDKLKALLYAGRVRALLKRLRKILRDTAERGPGTKTRRAALKSLIGYLRPRLSMMRYGVWMAQDLVIASGQVEGAVRYLVGERFDCAGMRWTRAKAEALLHLRCIELNGDWQKFANWFEREIRRRLKKGQRCKVLTNQPMDLKTAA